MNSWSTTEYCLSRHARHLWCILLTVSLLVIGCLAIKADDAQAASHSNAKVRDQGQLERAPQNQKNSAIKHNFMMRISTLLALSTFSGVLGIWLWQSSYQEQMRKLRISSKSRKKKRRLKPMELRTAEQYEVAMKAFAHGTKPETRAINQGTAESLDAHEASLQSEAPSKPSLHVVQTIDRRPKELLGRVRIGKEFFNLERFAEIEYAINESVKELLLRDFYLTPDEWSKVSKYWNSPERSSMSPLRLHDSFQAVAQSSLDEFVEIQAAVQRLTAEILLTKFRLRDRDWLKIKLYWCGQCKQSASLARQYKRYRDNYKSESLSAVA